MELTRRAGDIGGRNLLSEKIQHFHISGQAVANRSFAEAIISKYEPLDEYGLPSASFVYYGPEKAVGEAGNILLLSRQLLTLNHFRITMLRPQYTRNFYQSVKSRCELLFYSLGESLIWKRERERLFHVYKEILKLFGAKGPEDERKRQQLEEEILAVEKLAKRMSPSGGSLLADSRERGKGVFSQENGIGQLKDPEQENNHMRLSLRPQAAGKTMSPWKSEQARAFFWKVQRASGLEQEILFKAYGVSSLVGLMNRLKGMDSEQWIQETQFLGERIAVVLTEAEADHSAANADRPADTGFLAGTGHMTGLREQENAEASGRRLNRNVLWEDISLELSLRLKLLDEAVDDTGMEYQKNFFLELLKREEFPAKRVLNLIEDHGTDQSGSIKTTQIHEELTKRLAYEASHMNLEQWNRFFKDLYSLREIRELYILEAVKHMDPSEWEQFKTGLYRRVFLEDHGERRDPGQFKEFCPQEQTVRTKHALSGQAYPEQAVSERILPEHHLSGQSLPEQVLSEQLLSGSSVESALSLSPLWEQSPFLHWIKIHQEWEKEAASFTEEKVTFLNALSEMIERAEKRNEKAVSNTEDVLEEVSRVALGEVLKEVSKDGRKGIPAANLGRMEPETEAYPPGEKINWKSATVRTAEESFHTAESLHGEESFHAAESHHAEESHHAMEALHAAEALHAEESLHAMEALHATEVLHSALKENSVLSRYMTWETGITEQEPVLYGQISEAVSYMDQVEWSQFTSELLKSISESGLFSGMTAKSVADFEKGGSSRIEPQVDLSEEALWEQSPLLCWVKSQQGKETEPLEFIQNKQVFLDALSGEIKRAYSSFALEKAAPKKAGVGNAAPPLAKYKELKTAETLPVEKTQNAAEILNTILKENRILAGYMTWEPELEEQERELYGQISEAVSYMDQVEWNQFTSELLKSISESGLFSGMTAKSVADFEKGGSSRIEPQVDLSEEALWEQSPLLCWVKSQQGKGTEPLEFIQNKQVFLDALSGEIKRVYSSFALEKAAPKKAGVGNAAPPLAKYKESETAETLPAEKKQNAAEILNTVLKENHILAGYMTWEPELEGQERELYGQIGEAVSYMDQAEWKQFKNELFESVTRTVSFPGQKTEELHSKEAGLKEVLSYTKEQLSFPEQDLSEQSPLLHWFGKQREQTDEAAALEQALKEALVHSGYTMPERFKSTAETAGQKRELLYSQVLETVSRMDPGEWKQFGTRLLNNISDSLYETAADTEDFKEQEPLSRQPLLQWIRQQKVQSESALMEPPRKHAFLESLSRELEIRRHEDVKRTFYSRLGENVSRRDAGERQTPAEWESSSMTSPFLLWLKDQRGQAADVSGTAQDKQAFIESLEKEFGAFDRKKEIRKHLAEFLDASFGSSGSVHGFSGRGRLITRNIWENLLLSGTPEIGPGVMINRTGTAGSRAGITIAGRPADQTSTALRTEAAVTLLEYMRNSRIAVAAPASLSGSSRLSYEPASLVINRGTGMAQRQNPDVDQGISRKVETEVTRQIKEQTTDIQFITKNGPEAGTVSESAQEAKETKEALRELIEQIEKQQKDLEELRQKQSLTHQTSSPSRLSRSVLKQVQSQIRMEQMRHGI